MTSGMSLVRRRAPAIIAVVLVMLGLIAVVVRLDGPSDGTVLRLGRSTWLPNGVVIDVLAPSGTSPLQPGDVVTGIGGVRLADGLGGLDPPRLGETVGYDIAGAGAPAAVLISRPDTNALLRDGWGDLVFVVALAALAAALYLRRPDEPATTPLLIAAAGLLGSTLAVVAALPALALATGGPVLWLFHLNTIAAYSIAWGAVVAVSIRFTVDHPWLRGRRWVLIAAYVTPVTSMALWAAATSLVVANPLRWLGLLHAGQTFVTLASLAAGTAASWVGYRRTADPVSRNRLRWIAGGGAVTVVVAVLGWHLPELITGRQALPSGALGLSGIPFVIGIAIALQRHRLFEIERLANRSLVYASVVAVLVAGYAATVAVLASGLRISGTVAAAIAAAAAALALAPLRNMAQRLVNRMMYGDRDDPAGVLARLGARLEAVVLPGDVLPAVVETVSQSLRVPYVAVDLADGAGGFRPAAEHGHVVGPEHSEPLTHHGTTVGRLRVSDRGRDDPLDPGDLALIRSLASSIGAAVQAARLHQDLVRSRAEVVTLREDERRRLRRDLHDGLGPSLAAIGLKAGMAARALPPDSAARGMLNEIGSEVKSGLGDIRRLVEELRPPALDELGLVGAVRLRAASLAGELAIEVDGPNDRDGLPAAVETAAFRIAVEAMTNAVRHSGGQQCLVAIVNAEREVIVTVQDDGSGLDPVPSMGVGLRSMSERAAELGGSCSVRSAPEGGTLVEARLPLDLKENGRNASADPR